MHFENVSAYHVYKWQEDFEWNIKLKEKMDQLNPNFNVKENLMAKSAKIGMTAATANLV